MKSRLASEVILFNVTYEDGTMTSNRKVASSILGGLEGDEPARAAIEAQDLEIAERSGRPRGGIKTIVRSEAR